MILGVPYDAEIEYLESTGTQYIDTEVKVQYISTTSRQVSRMAFVGEGSNRQLTGSNGFLYMGRNGNSYEICNNLISVVDSNFHDFEMTVTIGSNLEFEFDGVSHIGQSLSYNQGYQFAIYLFAIGGRGGAAASFFCNARVAKYQLYIGTTLVRNFIPVRVGQTGYMYDRVTKRLFGNKGTGSFVLGPDVAKPVMGLYGMRKFYSTTDYIQDGLVAMWDGINNSGHGHDPKTTMWKDLVGGLELTLMSGGSWDDTCIVGDGTAPAAGTVIGVEPPNVLKQPFVETVCSVQEYPARHGRKPAMYLRYLGTNNYQKMIGICDSYGTVYFLANQRLTKVSTDNYLAKNTIALFSTERNIIQECYINSQSRSAASNDGSGEFGTGFLIGAVTLGSSPGWTNPTKTKVYCIRFYNRALSPAEIAHNYAIDKERFNLP